MSSDHSKRFPVTWLTSILGFIMLALWFTSEAITVVPDSPAVFWRWTSSAASLFLGGLLFGVAISSFLFRRQAKAG